MELAELWAIFGPGFAGAIFGAGWWFWVDAVVCSYVKVSFVHYLPGIFASLAALMFNCVKKEDIDYSPYDEGEWSLTIRRAEDRKGFVDNEVSMLWKLRVQTEAVAFPCLCHIVRLFSGISWSIGARFTRENWPISLDRNCRCLAVCVCVGQWFGILDLSLRKLRKPGMYASWHIIV
ncbi:hypothetical protein ACFE04_011660 [Oxalis oulophora]